MKKIITIALALLLLLSFAACGKAEEESSAESSAAAVAGRDSVTEEKTEEEQPEDSGEEDDCSKGTCDNDGDFLCDVTGEPLCGEKHYNFHMDGINFADNACDFCGTAMVATPHVYMVGDMLCIRPGLLRASEYPDICGDFDSVNCEFEIYNLDTGRLICTRSRSEFVPSGHGAGDIYNEGTGWYDAAIKVNVYEISDAPVCNIGVRAKSLDENYASAGMACIEYIAASELEPINATIDENGVLHIGNRNKAHKYYAYVVKDGVSYGVCYLGENQEDDVDLKDTIRWHGDELFGPPENGRYLLQVYEATNWSEKAEAALQQNPELNVGAEGAYVWYGNYETAEFYLSEDEYNALIEEHYAIRYGQDAE